MMRIRPLRSAAIAALAGSLCAPGVLYARSQAEPQSEPPAQHLRSLDAAEARRMLDALRAEQAKLRDGEKAFFHLSSGAPASYDQNRIGPRDAFVALDLDDVWQIERTSRDGAVFPTYRLTLIPDGQNAPIWTLDVTMTWPRDVVRIIEVTRFYGPPGPF